MVSDKLRGLIKMKGLIQTELGQTVFGMSKASFNNKLRTAETRFSVSDLIKLAEATGTTLCLVDKKSGKTVIDFDVDDVA